MLGEGPKMTGEIGTRLRHPDHTTVMQHLRVLENVR
jgi:hypothetical protein